MSTMDYDTYRKAYFADPLPSPRYHLKSSFGVTLYFEDYEAAIATLHHHMDTDPHHKSDVHYYAALAYQWLGRHTQAIRELDVLIETRPEFYLLKHRVHASVHARTLELVSGWKEVMVRTFPRQGITEKMPIRLVLYECVWID